MVVLVRLRTVSDFDGGMLHCKGSSADDSEWRWIFSSETDSIVYIMNAIPKAATIKDFFIKC